MRLVFCPVCSAVQVAHLGIPPGTGHDWRNRCQASALTGSPNYGNTHRYWREQSFRFPKRGSGRCGAPLTDRIGWPIPPPDPDEWLEIVRATTTHGVFDPRDLWKLAYGD